MAANPEVDGIVELPAPAAPAPEPESEPPSAKARRVRPPWLRTALVGGVALVSTGTLGYVANTAAQQRDQAFDAFVSTKTTLVATDSKLTQAKQDAATKTVTADYVAMYVADTGRIETDYGTVGACSSFSTCRTGAQQLLEDLQKFQSDRGAATVPSSLSAGDASTGDALSAAIAADQEIISGMDTGSLTKFKDGFTKLDAAMLNVAKAEASVGSGL